MQCLWKIGCFQSILKLVMPSEVGSSNREENRNRFDLHKVEMIKNDNFIFNL